MSRRGTRNEGLAVIWGGVQRGKGGADENSWGAERSPLHCGKSGVNFPSLRTRNEKYFFLKKYYGCNCLHIADYCRTKITEARPLPINETYQPRFRYLRTEGKWRGFEGSLNRHLSSTQFEMLSGADMITSGPSGCLSISKQKLHPEFLSDLFQRTFNAYNAWIYILIDW